VKAIAVSGGVHIWLVVTSGCAPTKHEQSINLERAGSHREHRVKTNRFEEMNFYLSGEATKVGKTLTLSVFSVTSVA
jgi:hypothetical protein